MEFAQRDGHRRTAGALLIVLLPILAGCAALEHRQAQLHVEKGEQLLARDDLEAALAEFEAANALDPQLAVAHSKMGIIYRRMGQYDRAIDCFANAVRFNPFCFEDTFALAQLYHFTKRLHDAVQAYLQACDLSPENFDAQLNLGVCYQQMGDCAQAVERFQQAIAIDPDRPYAYVNLGVAYDAQGKCYEAVSAYKNALERDNHQPLVLVNLAGTYMKQERLKMARNALEQAVKMDPALPAAREGLGHCLFRMQRYDEAETNYLEALAYDPRLASAHAGLGSIQMLRAFQDPHRDQLREQALEHWHRSLELNPNQPRIRRLIEKYRVHPVDPTTVLLDQSAQP